MTDDPKQTEEDLQEYARLSCLSLAVGFVGFNFDWWLLVKLPFFVSGIVLLYAAMLYISRR